MTGATLLQLASAAPLSTPEVADSAPAPAGTIADAEFASHHETVLGLDSYGVVAVAFVLFMLILWRVGAFGFIARSLDSQVDKVKTELAEATRLRAEAEALKAEAAAHARELEAQAAATLANAEAEAERIIAQASVTAAEAIARQQKLAEERLQADARNAEAELRGRAADLALKAATELLRDRADSLDDLTDRAIASLGPR